MIGVDFLYRLLNCELPEDKLEIGPRIKERQPRFLIRDEVAQAIRTLKHNNETGDDEITVEMRQKWRGGMQ